jgi:hypothetical protein
MLAAPIQVLRAIDDCLPRRDRAELGDRLADVDRLGLLWLDVRGAFIVGDREIGAAAPR